MPVGSSTESDSSADCVGALFGGFCSLLDLGSWLIVISQNTSRISFSSVICGHQWIMHRISTAVCHHKESGKVRENIWSDQLSIW